MSDLSSRNEEESVRKFFHTQSTEVIQDAVKGYLNQSESDSLEILVAGKMGVGKSSLINSIFGCELAKEGHGAAAVTNKLEKHVGEVKFNGKTSTITFWDSPGFGDVFDKNEEKTTQELVQKVKKAGVFLYCFDVRGRLQHDDINGMIEITKKLGSDIWNKAIFTLNFSNDCKPPLGHDENPRTYFTSMFNSWHSEITKALKDQAGVPDNITNNIRVLATGYRGVQPPGCADWFTSLFTCMFERLSDASYALLRLAINRVSCTPNTTCEAMINLYCGSSLPAPNSASVPQSLKEQSTVSASAEKEHTVPADDKKESVVGVVVVGAVAVCAAAAVITAGVLAAAGAGAGAALSFGVTGGIFLVGLIAYGVYKYYKRHKQQDL